MTTPDFDAPASTPLPRHREPGWQLWHFAAPTYNKSENTDPESVNPS